MNHNPLPSGWRWTTLGEVTSPVLSTNPARTPRVPFTYIDISSVDSREKRIVLPRSMMGQDAPSRARQIVETNDVLIATTRPNLNAVAHVPPELNHAVASTGFCVLRATEALFPDFLFLFVVSRAFVENLTKLTDGALYPAVTDKQVRAQRIPLPPLEEQRRIAQRLQDQLAKLETARTAAQVSQDALRSGVSATLSRVFGDLDARGVPTSPLGAVLKRHNEIVHPGTRSGWGRFVGLEHVESHTGRRIGEARLDLGAMTGRKPTFQPGQIVYGYLRPYLNKVWLADFEGYSSVDQFAFSVDTTLADVRFVAWFMRSPLFLQRASQRATPGQLPRLAIEEIEGTHIPLPSRASQSQIADTIDESFGAHQVAAIALQRQLQALDALPAALLRRAFYSS